MCSALLGCLDTSLNQVSIASGGKKNPDVAFSAVLCNTEYSIKAGYLNLEPVFLMSRNFDKGLSFCCLLMCLSVLLCSHSHCS